MFDPKVFILLTPVLLLALTVHEFSHGLVAYLLGDPTPKLAKRLSLNPIKHLDFFGTLTLFITQAIGWAKPVPINPNYFKNPWRDMALVSIAGPLSNILLAFIFGFLFHLFYGLNLNYSSFVISQPLALMCFLGIKINLGLAIFNLLPIPPLDGSKVIVKFLPKTWRFNYLRLEMFGFIFILILAITGVLSKFIYPILNWLTNLILGITSIGSI
ncbi:MULTISPECIES: site-2 protease family protein [Thermodesulfobacterium]|uniref:Peptidase n=1 Tax=Thermodesulfobacterium commune DSM 2178 TaxID=289377 RepID=A0A075WTB7_9BACT|nr:MULTISPECIES: site-2 protease family protein [Thermodesulfobacterium]AIH04081.1 peptidase [Thermodesulfobacterium commune DSM 2178]